MNKADEPGMQGTQDDDDTGLWEDDDDRTDSTGLTSDESADDIM